VTMLKTMSRFQKKHASVGVPFCDWMGEKTVG
jgi:hypothetical protein